jgi:general secretion pathway protein L
VSSSASRLLQRTTRLDFLDGVGIAVGQRSVGLAHLVKRLATVSLAHHRLVALPPSDQTAERRTALTEAVRAFFRDGAIETDRCYVALPRRSALISRLSLPAAAKSDLAQVIEFELERLVPIAREEIYFDFLVRDLGAKLDVQVVSLPRRAVAEVLGALEDAGVLTRSVTITPIALLDFAGFCDLGTSAPVTVLRQDASDVEMDLFAQGTLAATHVLRAAEVASMPAVTRLVGREIAATGSASESLQVFALIEDGAGGDPLLPPELSDSGRELLKRAEGRLTAPEGFFETAPPALIPALGAGLAAVREATASFNALPAEERRTTEEGAPVITFLFAALLVLVTVLWLVSAMIKDHAIASRLHSELAELEPRLRTAHKNEEEARQLRDKLGLLTRDDRRRSAAFLLELTNVIPPDAYLTTFRVRSDRVELEGFARSASDLIPLIEKSPLFKNPQFTSPVTKVQDNQERFSLTSEIAQ